MYNVRKIAEDLYWCGANDQGSTFLKTFTPFRSVFHTIATCFWMSILPCLTR